MAHDCGYIEFENKQFMRNVIQSTQVGGKSFKTPGGTPSVLPAFTLFRSFNF